ncbi:heme-binding protein 2 isoform X2 [Nerophis ophidion]|uniref:heme-binding protein 2 isoform X2 n=1 Tax=Nerophis ophidion TaxID=159077 RepID=UPI002AE067AA|nr:heme-binding protein 2 isoform X2 [Nerophis ophidion]
MKPWRPASAGYSSTYKATMSTVQVEMTAPVTGHVDPGAGPTCESHFTVSFFIPVKHQANPPEPSDPDVFVEHRKEFTVYVRTYGGFSNENLKKEELLKLVESLKRDGVEFVDKPYYVAGYDSPFKLLNRRNECSTPSSAGVEAAWPETGADPSKQPRQPTPLSASVQSAWMSDDMSKETEVSDTCSPSQDTAKPLRPSALC